MKKTLLLFLFIVISDLCLAQIDTAFWFAAPDISSDFGYDQPINLVITSFQQPCVVTISIPANAAIVPQTISLAANTTQSVDLTAWLSNLECGPGNVVQNKGLKILSDNKISAYYSISVGGPNPEFFSLKGINALGTSFYISSQYLLDNSPEYNPAAFSSFNIVATEDNTNITILPTNNIVGHSAGVPFLITLNRGQTYAAIAASQAAANHLQGSSVISTKPIAITLADDLLNGGVFGNTCRDLAGDQTVPVNVIGMEYIAIRSNLNFPYDKVYITATQNGTTVTQDGIFLVTLNAGQSSELTISTPVTYIQTSKPAYAFQLSGYGCEAGAAILPKINCTGSPSVSVSRTTNEVFSVCLLVKNGGQGNFLLNGSSSVITAANFSVVPGTGGQWYYAKVVLPLSTYPYGSVITVSNTTTLFQEGILAGSSLGNGFGYFSNFNTLLANASAIDTSFCVGENLQLLADFIPSATYTWTGPNSFLSNQQNPVINNTTMANAGDYILSVDVTDCGIFKDTVHVHIYSPVSSTTNQTICEGQSFEGYNVTGNYVDVFTGQNGCDSTRTLNLIVKPTSFTTVNQSICEGQSFGGHSTAGTYITTLIAANGCDSIVTLNLVVIPRTYSTINQSICEGEVFLGYSTTGTYHDTLTNANGCDSVRVLNLTVKVKSVSIVNHAICQGQSYLGYTVAGAYVDIFTGSNGCDSTRTLNLQVNQPTTSVINQIICEGDTYAGYSISGVYVDIFINNNGCDSTRTLHLTVKPRAYSFLSQHICSGQSYEGHTTTGVFIDTLVAANSCDSVRTIDLTVDPVPSTIINHAICTGSSYLGYTVAGTYIDTFTTIHGCDSIRTLNLHIDQLPLPDLGADQTICLGEQVVLMPGTYNAYTWQDGGHQNTYTVTAQGLYFVTVQNSCGTGTDSVKINADLCELIFPNAFTPNNDGLNDVFKALHVFRFESYQLRIYNRWGEKVFETFDFMKGWDGQIKAVKADVGSYVWYCNYRKAGVDGKLKGSVILIR